MVVLLFGSSLLSLGSAGGANAQTPPPTVPECYPGSGNVITSGNFSGATDGQGGTNGYANGNYVEGITTWNAKASSLGATGIQGGVTFKYQLPHRTVVFTPNCISEASILNDSVGTAFRAEYEGHATNFPVSGTGLAVLSIFLERSGPQNQYLNIYTELEPGGSGTCEGTSHTITQGSDTTSGGHYTRTGTGSRAGSFGC